MRSITTRRFRDAFRRLPASVQQQARIAYRTFLRDPFHPGLSFKQIDEEEGIYSARVGLNYRVLGKRTGAQIVWYWIGPHGEYDKKV